ncbi:MAG: RagB/SusD family nutrient uptake outer membrane protein [Cyclobacteriaceae bacterium]
MKIFRYNIYVACLLLTGLFAGCQDEFLDRPPLSSIVDGNYYQTAEQVLAGTAPLYNIVWFSYNDKASHGIGDARGGVLTSGSYQLENIQMNTTGVTAENGSAWRSFFNVVGQSNTVINNINQYAAESVPESIKRHGIAEARFMRGLAYSFLVQNWGAVPIITNNTTLLQDTTKSRNTIESVWQFIIRDMRYAASVLPESPVQEGRLTRWSAEGMLSKMYLTRAGISGTQNAADLDSAAFFAKSVIDNSGGRLMEEYADLFKTSNNNNAESLFALQWVYNGDWGANNSVQAYLAYGSEITGFADGWGGDIGASLYILNKYEDFNTDERRKATFMFPAAHYSDITQVPAGGSAQELRVPVNSTDADGQAYNSRVWVKKYVVGRPEDNGGEVLQQRTSMSTYMLRLADVYLVYAEAVLNSNPSEALTYLNLVRERAGLAPKTAITWQDIFDERLVEFAMEGQSWYDFVRLHYYDPQRAYDILSNQDRGFFRIYPDQTPDPTSWSIEIDESDDTRKYTVNSSNFYLPLPATELSRAPNLRKPPVPYNFDQEGAE